MRANQLRTKNAPRDTREQEAGRKKPLAVPLAVEEYRAWKERLRAFGFPNAAEGIRIVMRCFFENPDIAEAVRQASPEAPYKRPAA